MPRRTPEFALALLLAGVAAPALASSHGAPIRPQFEPTYAPPPPPPTEAPTGAIFQASRFTSLVEDNRARRAGDVLTITLVESTQASKQASQQTSKDSNIGITLPTAKPFSFIPKGLLSGGGTNSFKGAGQAAQANSLSGEVSVTVAQVYSNGTLFVRGQKLIQLTRGEESIQISGIVRPEDVSPDNKVLSTRVADAKIAYSGTGEVATATKQGWLQRFFSAISPF